VPDPTGRKLFVPFAVLSALMITTACAERNGEPAPVLLAGLLENPGAGVVNVGPGDTVYEIAKRYRLPMADVIEFNRLQPPFTLEIGQRIQLPPPREYTVQPGDSLYTVSRAFAVDSRQIATLNGLQPPYELSPNQSLRLPSPTQTTELPEPTTVVVDEQPVMVAPVDDRTIYRDGVRPAPLPERKPGTAVSSQVVIAPEPAPRNTVADSAPAITAGTPGIPVPVEKPLSAPVATAALPPPPAPPMPAVTAPAPRVAVAPPPPQRVEPTPAPAVRVPQKAVNQAPPPRTGSFSWPLLGRLVSGYGPKSGGLHNDGINIAAPKGAPVRAAERGIVAYAGNELRGFGNLLLIRHSDGWMTAYAHLDRLLIGRGETVDAGATIGTVGNSGSVDSPQLHFEIRRGSRALDPMLYLPRQTSSAN